MTSRTGHHRGGNSGGLIWTYDRPPPPPGPHRQERALECSLVFLVSEWLYEGWTDRCNDGPEDREPLQMLMALTGWYCALELPSTRREMLDGPPILGRRRRRG